MLKENACKFIIIAAFLAACLPQTALAYIGPGTGLTAIGSFLALIVGIIVAILGFLWYPFKRLLGRKKTQEPDQIEDEKS